MKETAFIGLYRGRSVGDARLIPVSSDPEIVAKFFRELVRERQLPEVESPASEESGASLVQSPADTVDQPQPPREVQQQREDARLVFTVLLLVIFALQLAIGAIALFVGPETWSNAEEYLRVTLPATLGVLGSAIGFYFGSQR